MAEFIGALGAGASAVTMGEFAVKIKWFGSKVKCAPEDWERYWKGLEGLAHIQAVIIDVIKQIESPSNLSVNVNGRSEGLLDFCNANLDIVRSDAQDLLKKFDLMKYPKTKKFKTFLQKLRGRYLFVLKNEYIRDLIQGVEHAKSSLQVALAAAILSRTNSGHRETQVAIQGVKDQMNKQSKVLDKLRKDSQLKQRSVGVSLLPARTTPPSRWRPFKKNKRSPQAADEDAQTTSSSEILRLSNEDDPLISRPIILDNGEECSPSGQRLAIQSAETIESTCNREMMHGALILEPVGHNDETHDDRSHESADDPQMRQFDIDFSDCQLIIVGTDSEVGTSNAHHEMQLIKVNAGEPNMPIRIANFIEETSEDDLELYVQSDVDEFIDFLESTAALDNESDSGQSLANIEIKDQSSIFIAKTVAIEKCRSNASGNLFFCVDRLNLHVDMQVFALKEPCDSSNRCNHVTIEGLEGESITCHIPTLFPISFTPGPAGTESDAEETFRWTRDILSPFERCRERCAHTLVEESDSRSVKCAVKAHFRASFGRQPSEDWDTDNDSENVDSENDKATHDGGDCSETTDDHAEKEQSNAERQRTGPFSSLPCLPCFFCHKDAVNPEFESVFDISFIVYSSLSYGYKCSRCEQKTWITGARWLWS